MKKTFKRLVKKVTVAPPPPPQERETETRFDYPPPTLARNTHAPLPPDDSPVYSRGHAHTFSEESAISVLRAWQNISQDDESVDGSIDSPPPSRPMRHRSTAHLVPRRSMRPPSGPVVGPPPQQLARRSLSLWERRQQNPRLRRRSLSPPRVHPPARSTASDSPDLSNLPSAELRSMMEEFIDRRGAWRAAQATERAWQADSPTQPNDARSSRQSTPNRHSHDSPGSQRALRSAIMNERLEDDVTVGSLSPIRFAFQVPSTHPLSRSTGTVRAEDYSRELAERLFGREDAEADFEEWRFQESTIGFEDAILEFAAASGFDLDVGMDIHELEGQHPEVRGPRNERRLSVRALEEAAEAMAQATPPRETPCSASRESTHSQSFLDLERTPNDKHEWTAKSQPDTPCKPLSSPSPSMPPRLPMLDIPTMSLSDAEFWSDLSFESTATVDESSPDTQALQALEESATLPRRLESLESISYPSRPLLIDNDKTPTASTSNITQRPATGAISQTPHAPPPASPRLRSNILRKISEPLLQKFGTRRRRNPFRSADLGRQAEGYLQLIDGGDNPSPSTPVVQPQEPVASLTQISTEPLEPNTGLDVVLSAGDTPFDSMSSASPQDHLASLAEISTEPLQPNAKSDLDLGKPSSRDDSAVTPVIGAVDDDDDLGSFGDLLARFPSPPQHKPPFPLRTPSRIPTQPVTAAPSAEEDTPNTQDIVQTPSTQAAPPRSMRTEPLSFGDGAIQLLTTPPTPDGPELTGTPILQSPLTDPTKRWRLRIKRSSSAASQSAQPEVKPSEAKGKAKALAPESHVGDPEIKAGPSDSKEDNEKTIRPTVAQLKQLKDFDSMLKSGETARLSVKGKGEGDGVRRGGFV